MSQGLFKLSVLKISVMQVSLCCVLPKFVVTTLAFCLN